MFSLLEAAKSSKIFIRIVNNQLAAVFGAKSLEIFRMYAFYDSYKTLFE